MKKFVQIVLALSLLVPAAAWAQQKGGITIRSVSEIEIKQKNADGKEEVKRVDATKTKVLPGDVVIYTNHYAYNGDKPATDVIIKNPVPEHMIYMDGTAEGKGTKIEFSVDKGKTYATADKVKVKTADGKERRAAAADYTNIQWTLETPLQKGGKGSVSFRAKVK
jgi:uncharacterized repeat protein (TIGR01451 family)